VPALLADAPEVWAKEELFKMEAINYTEKHFGWEQTTYLQWERRIFPAELSVLRSLDKWGAEGPREETNAVICLLASTC